MKKKFVLALFIGLGIVFILSKSSPLNKSASVLTEKINLDENSSKKRGGSIEESIEARQFNLSIKRKLLSSKIKSDAFKEDRQKEPPNPYLKLEGEDSSLDLGLSGKIKNTENEALLKDLSEKHFVNDLYQDPENEVRTQWKRKQILEKRLKEKNKRAKDQFVEDFVKSAQEQGYNVYHLEGTKVILEPKEEKTLDPPSVEGAFEDVKINWE